VCRGTRTRGVGEVVDDEPARRELVNDESRDKPHDVPKQPDARRRKIDPAFDRSKATCFNGSRRVDK
jgi:hypothetical protein